MSRTLSSITKKIFMALLGLFLVVFLLVHLGINLFILPLCENHVEIFEKAAHFMGTNPVIKIFEVVLFLAFLLHIIFGIILWFQNQSARPVKYLRANQSETSFFSKYMIHTGVIIFIFLIIHFMNFYFVKLGLVAAPDGMGNDDMYDMAIRLFSMPVYSLIYIVAFIFLGFHLNHAFQSAFQTMGWNHTKYFPCIKTVGTIYAIFVSVGFTVIPLYYLIMN